MVFLLQIEYGQYHFSASKISKFKEDECSLSQGYDIMSETHKNKSANNGGEESGWCSQASNDPWVFSTIGMGITAHFLL